MLDTIELLETIGTNAALRHASAEQLGQALSNANASDALKAAVASQDKSLLLAELGGGGQEGPPPVDHNPHTIWNG